MTILGWMVYAAFVSSLIAAGAWLLDRGLVRVGLPSRWMWAVALTVSAGLPVAVGLGRAPTDSADLVGDARVIAPPDAPGSLSSPDGLVMRVMERATEGVSGAVGRVARLVPDGPAARSWAVGLWLSASLALAVALLVSRTLLALRARGWPTSSRGRRTFRISPRLGPAALGLLRPEIVVPRWALSLSSSDLALILDHEEEHVRARDPLLLAIGVIPVLAAPWNPVLWWQVRRLRDAIEVDTDRRVLRRGAAPASYGRLLLDVEGRAHREILPIPAMSGSPSLLERRLSAMKTRSRRRTIPEALVAVVAALALVAVACQTEPPTAEDEAGGTAAAGPESTRVSADSSLRMDLGRALGDSLRPLVFVDGVDAANADVLDGLDPSDIASIEVIKGPSATAVWGERARGGVIQITTKAAASPEPAPAPEPEPEPRPQPAPEPALAPAPEPEPSPSPQPVVSPDGGSELQQDTLAQPTFTPYEVAPEILNRAEIQQALASEYPPALRDLGIGGRVLLNFHIGQEGVLDQVQVAQTSGNEDLDAAAVRVARTFRFVPAQNQGKPVAVWIQVPIAFEPR
jgi:TonB family protein